MTDDAFKVLMSDKAISSDEYEEMKLNYSGYSVTALQASLVQLGYLSDENATGVIDDNTISAVKMAQANFALEVTGQIDNTFMDALLKQTTQESTIAVAKTSSVSMDNALVAGEDNIFEAVPYNSNNPQNVQTLIIISSVMFTLCFFALVVYFKNSRAKKSKAVATGKATTKNKVYKAKKSEEKE